MTNFLKLRYVYLVFSFSLLPITLFAQNVGAIKADRQTYIWGEGMGSTLKEADQIALADIIGQISTQVESSFEKTVLENGKNFKETVNDVLKTYSSATLKNTERIILQNEPDAKVFRYVKRSEVAKVFESRKNKLIELARDGELALKNLQIADALRYFYWSQTLLRSHPDASDIKMTTTDGSEVLAITWLPRQINEIFANIAVKIEAVEKMQSYTNCILDIRYKNQPVRNLDYTYWGGQDWSNIISAKDGIGVVELTKADNASEIRLKAEYAFEGEANIDMELRDVIQKLPQVPYKSCYITVGGKSASLSATVAGTNAKTTNANGTTTANNAKPSESIGANKTMESSMTILTNVADKEAVMKKIVSAINSKNYSNVQTLFAADGFAIFKNLLEYGNAKILKLNDLKYYQFGDLVICRSIPMSFSFKANNRTFVENVVFYFDKSNKICNLTFSLSKEAVDDIASNKSWPEQTRMLLMSFMENYKTAYSLKRLDYIEKIFSDDALIITGSVTKVNSSPEFRYLNNNIVKYNKQTKAKYLKNLEYSFKSNEFINIRFADNTVRRSGKENEVYGIQIKQDYFSTNYGDSGYLFLLIDLTDSINPQIHVRTWQPEKNADGSIYGLSDF